ncbi:Hypothetical predicted protein [Paramuricea clavata]|uniref:Uncharacterized protein n=1 Tax=Paramuricea clavata TaxID=317549 RepID=A0A6S7K4E8_PARCT|nr:Hypothetical predicted protein [Paramuricea clavata]
MADETTVISAVEQLSLCFSYYDCNEKTICENFIFLLDVLDKEKGSNPGNSANSGEVVVRQDSIPMTMYNFLQRCEEENQNVFEIEEPKLTGKVIGKAIWNEIEQSGLSPNAAVAQSYDGASVMSSTNVGT